MFDWNDLRYFLAVARHGSTLAAAKALRLSQSTVHRRLAALEQGLGCRLVERRPTGYRLTELGKKLVFHAESVEQAIAAFERSVSSSDPHITGTIRLTCATTVAHRLLKSAAGSDETAAGEAALFLRSPPPPHRTRSYFF